MFTYLGKYSRTNLSQMTNTVYIKAEVFIYYYLIRLELIHNEDILYRPKTFAK